jgi:hypothetical protein
MCLGIKSGTKTIEAFERGLFSSRKVIEIPLRGIKQ